MYYSNPTQDNRIGNKTCERLRSSIYAKLNNSNSIRYCIKSRSIGKFTNQLAISFLQSVFILLFLFNYIFSRPYIPGKAPFFPWTS